MSESSTAAARWARAQGWAPVPILPGEKRPAARNWPSLRYSSPAELDEAFTGHGIGLILGRASGGLVDVDLDSVESLRLARHVLTDTAMISGHPKARASHWWYRLDKGSTRVTKLSDPLDRSVLVELRGDGGQTLIPPSVHPEGIPYQWHDPRGALRELPDEPTVLPVTVLHRNVHVLAAASLLVRYWPEQGARHDAALALAGGLLYEKAEATGISPHWAHRYRSSGITRAAGFVSMVAHYGGDEEARARQNDVESTITRLHKQDRVRGWPSLAEILPDKVVWQVKEWLDAVPPDDEEEEEPSEDDGGTLKLYDLGGAIERGIPPPEQLLENVLYTGEVHWLQGHGGNGKTLLVAWWCHLLVQQGRKVLYLDEENGWREMGSRFASFGTPTPLLKAPSFFYAHMPGANWLHESTREEMLALVAEHEIDLVVYDSMADLMGYAQLDENANSDITLLYNTVMRELKQRGVTQVVIDHLSKESSYMARGASAKFAKAQIVWNVNKAKAPHVLNGRTGGKVPVKLHKSRIGVVPKGMVYDVIVREGTTSFAYNDDAELELVTPTTPLDVVVELLAEQAQGRDQAFTSTELRKRLPFSTAQIATAALAQARASLAMLPISMEQDGNTQRWWYTG